MKKEEGITLIALTITIIVLLILAGIGIGASTGLKKNIGVSQDTIAVSDLNKVQQAVFETYTKYMQSKNERVLKGVKITYAEAQNVALEFNKLDSNISLKITSAYDIENVNPVECYYKLTEINLKDIGLSNIEKDDEYIVNYSTGEVFNNTNKNTGLGTILYVSK